MVRGACWPIGCFRPRWSTATPVSSGPSTRSGCPGHDSCSSPRPTSRAHRTGSGRCSATGPRPRRAPATRWPIAGSSPGRLPGLYRDTRIHRIAPFFQAMRIALQSLAPSRAEVPRIVLLTSGAGSETAFDQAFLSSLLGFPLVEGTDLLVRDGNVWQRSIGRLEPVDVILRRVDAGVLRPARTAPRLAARRSGAGRGQPAGQRLDRQRPGHGRPGEPGALPVSAATGRGPARPAARPAVGPDLVVRRRRQPQARAGQPRLAGAQAGVAPDREHQPVRLAAVVGRTRRARPLDRRRALRLGRARRRCCPAPRPASAATASKPSRSCCARSRSPTARATACCPVA